MTSFCHQLKLLLWKNLILRKRHKVRIFMELLWPLFLFLILMWVRTRGLKTKNPDCHLAEKTLPSVGGFEFLQNFVCSLNNTCVDYEIENEHENLWEGALLTQFINRVTPVIKRILSSIPQTETIRQTTNDIVNYIKIMTGLASQENLSKLGNVKLKDLLRPDERRIHFMESAPSFTGTTHEELENFLEIIINLNSISQESIKEVLLDFQNNNCDEVKNYSLITMPNQQAFQRLCRMDRNKLLMLFTIYTNYMNKEGIAAMIEQVLDYDKVFNNIYLMRKDIDPEAIQNLSELFNIFKEFRDKFNDLSKDNSTNNLTIKIYQALCGVNLKSLLANSSAFGFDPSTANRFDSIRDRLKDWKSDSHSEYDETVSPACNKFFQQLEANRYTAFLWKQVKPLIRGELLYSPINNFTESIMKRIEKKFSGLKDVEYSLNSLIQILHKLRNVRMEGDKLFKIGQKLLDDPGTSDMILMFMSDSSEKQKNELKALLDTLSKTNLTEAFNGLDDLDWYTEMIGDMINCVKYNKTRGFATEYEAVKEGVKLIPLNTIWAVIVFTNISENETLPHHIHYKIRMDSDKIDGTRAIRDRLYSKGPRRRPIFDLKYITSGFIYLQEMIEQSLVEEVTGKSTDNIINYLQQFPYPCYIYDQYIRAISRTFPLFMVLAWVYASSMIVKSIVLEKEIKLKEVVKVMGLGNFVIWVGWFIDSFGVMFVSATILSIILKFGKILEQSDFFLIWAFMISFTVATISFSFLVSTFFNKANSAAAAGGILFFISYLPYSFLVIWEEELNWRHMLVGSLISNVAFGFGCTYFARYEEDGIGAQWDSLALSSVSEDDFNLSYCILMLWFDAILYFLLTLYIEAIYPGDSGMPKPWYFPFKFLKCWKKNEVVKDHYRIIPLGSGGDAVVEKEPDGLEKGVVVSNLSKIYSNGRIALENLSLNFYESQITSFLGHNGAGKTTTISILTGLFPPTSGTAMIYGLDIRKNMPEIRKDLGMCPQHNVLFDRLNVEEHLQFFAGLKTTKKLTEKEIMNFLDDLGIPQKRYEFPGNLSGGMKRKLSVAIAFVGGSKTVFLDEPTSGVDPYSRRSIWELLLKYKKGRTIILTTHYMDEADLLGDRIAIISRGKLKTLGTSLYLKSQFGEGYSLRLVKDETLSRSPHLFSNSTVKTPTSDLISFKSAKNRLDVKNFIHKIIPNAILTEDVGSELIFLLPYDSLPIFPRLFNDLDDNLKNLRLTSYGISDTTLEDVFLKITMSDLQEDNSYHQLSGRYKEKFRNVLHRFKCAQNVEEKQMNVENHLNENKEINVNPNDAPNLQATNVENIGVRVNPHDTNTTIIDIEGKEENDKKEIKEIGNEKDGDRLQGGTSQSQLNHGTHRNSLKEIKHDEIKSSIENIKTKKNSIGEIYFKNGSVGKIQSFKSQEEVARKKSIVNEKENESIGYETETEEDSNESHPITLEKQEKSKAPLPILQIWTICLKRLRNSNRNKKAMFFEIILPAVFIFLTLTFTLILPPPTNEDPLELTPWAYPNPNNVFFSENETNNNGSKGIIKEMTGPIGMGTACLKDQKQSKLCDRFKWTNESVQKFYNERKQFDKTDLKECSCSTGSLVCPNDVDPKPPQLKTQTNDVIQDLTKINISEYLLKTYHKNIGRRWGGFQFQVRDVKVNFADFVYLIDSLINLDQFNNSEFFQRDTIQNITERPVNKVWFENRGWISSPSYLNALHNMIFREMLPDEFKNQTDEFGITAINHPLNLTESQMSKENLKVAGLGVVHAICIIFALSFIPASFTVYLIEERVRGGKHLHLVSGVKPITYWVANILFDFAKYLIPVILCVILFIIFDAKAYISKESIASFICLLVFYGWASIPLMYPASFFFRIPSTAFVVLACSNLFIGVITTVSTFVLESFGDPELDEIGNILKKVFLIFPQYCLGRGLVELVKIDVIETASDKFEIKLPPKDRFDWDIIGKMLFFLLILGLFFFILNLFFEYIYFIFHCFKRCKKSQLIEDVEEDDEDVKREKERVLNLAKDDDSPLVSVNLTKIYPRKKIPSVNKISFYIDKGECFGLLGVNGAGKTSTFKMLTGDVEITKGKASICGFDVSSHLDSARNHFGYCPQEDGLDPLLNAHEQLCLYGRLRGMSNTSTNKAKDHLIKTLGLGRYADKRCGTYSGGNKRKLSTAVALIGDPDLVFLDEPTSGMDPGARRQLWKVILRLVKNGKSIVLTSHSMEECEALCSRLAIMVNGKFMCIGSLQHLKNRFGKGYTMTVRCSLENQKSFIAKISENLSSSKLEDTHCTQMKFNIPQEDIKLSDIFDFMHLSKDEELIEDYSVSQTTLDDIFVKFASNQKDGMEH